MQNTLLTFNPLDANEQRNYAGASEFARIASREIPGCGTVTVVADAHEDSNAVSVDITDYSGKTLIYGAEWNAGTVEDATRAINASNSLFEVIYFLSLDQRFSFSGSL
jgi:hypothetical protein